MDIKDMNQLAIEIDITTSMAVYAMAKACSIEEVRGFFTASRTRLLQQGFEAENIDVFIKQMEKVIEDIKKF